jgi:hypothetical protein
VSLLLGACAPGAPVKPDLPESVSPGWKLASLSQSPGECWKADYIGASSSSSAAEALICRYKEKGSAFNAAQRARAEAQTVKFEQGRYFVVVKWNNAPKSDLAALVRAIQKALQPTQ